MLLVNWVVLLLLPAGTAAANLRRTPLKRNVALQLQDYVLQLQNFENVQYSGAFTLGTQMMPVVYDTGSFEVLVLSTKCYTCSANLKKYDESQSSSFVSANGLQATHMFGSGPVRSEKGYETLYIGDSNSPYGSATQPFWQIIDHEIAAWNSQANFAGIVGLAHTPTVPEGFGAESSTTEATLLSAMNVDLFAFCLQRAGPQPPPGWLVIGPSLQTKMSSGFSSIPVVGQVHWGVKMTSFSVPGLSAANPCVPSCGVIIDSGTSLLAVPPSLGETVSALKQMLNPDCSNLNAMPHLQITLDGVQVELPPRAYVMKVTQMGMKIPMTPNGIWRTLWDGPSWEGVDQCRVIFMVMDQQSQFGPVWILGMPFLRQYYTIFERTAKRIHIARASDNCQAPYTGPMIFSNYSGVNGTGSRKYLTSDYQPDQVDLRSARIPDWATAPKNGTFIL